MKTKLHFLFIGLALLAGVHSALAQNPVITSFSQNGALVCSNLQPGSVASVEWASVVTGPWHTNWAGLDAATADSNGTIAVSVPMNGTIAVSVPMFYRVRGVAPVTNPPVTPTYGMVLIPAGSFTMGDSTDGASDATPTVTVNVSAFYMDTNLVSLSQWQGVYSYATSHGYILNAGTDKAANTPVETVDWYDCVKWSNARSQQAGLTPVYYTDAGFTQVFTNGDNGTTVYANWSANGYRLPTEAEWEKAARGGLSGQRFPWGNTISESQANYYGMSYNFAYDFGPDGFNAIGNYPMDSVGTTPVGSFAPNGYGLYDMVGNVWEWCWDWYAGPAYPVGSPYLGGTDPRGPVGHGPRYSRVIRGGFWASWANTVRCAYRYDADPNGGYYAVGFRCVKGL
jgi:formylglycine-generating enzyme required for sulfatase activity